jgi:hypothetical protein
VKNRFQNLPFKFNLQRYSAEDIFEPTRMLANTPSKVGLCTLESS